MPEVYARETRVLNFTDEEILKLIGFEGYRIEEVNRNSKSSGNYTQFIVERNIKP